MIHCPKCGFEQPADQYCANCGIDMPSFVPPRKPIHQRVIRSPFVHVMVLILIIGGVYNYIQRQQHRELTERLELSRSLDHSEERGIYRKRNLKARSEELARLSEKQLQKETTRRENLAQRNTQKSKREKYETREISKNLNSEPVKLTQPTSFSLKLVELNADLLNKLVHESQNSGRFYNSGELALGLINLMSAKSATPIQTLRTWSGQLSEGSTDYHFFAGTNESDQSPELGLRTFVVVSSDGTLNQYEFEITRSIPIVEDESISSEHQSLKENISLGPGDALIIVGILPPAGSVDSDSQEAYPSIFNTLFKESYRNNESDLALILTQE